MSKQYKKGINIFEQAGGKIFWFLLVAVFSLVISYGVFVNMAILNGKNSQNFNQEISKISQELGDLEFKYLESKNKITLDLALSSGFTLVSNQKFVERGYFESTLSMNK